MRIYFSFIASFFLISIANAADFTLTSKSFSDKGKYPVLYTCNGKGISPAFKWANPPAGTQTYALTILSPDWSAGVYLWVLYNIPSNIQELAEGASDHMPSDIMVGKNYYYETTYRGPCPPDHIEHNYIFTIYALDSRLELLSGAEPEEVLEQINKHLLKSAQMSATFSH